MPKFLVYIDGNKPYEVESPSRVVATLDAMDKHRSARRITVKPVVYVPMRIVRRFAENLIAFAFGYSVLPIIVRWLS